MYLRFKLSPDGVPTNFRVTIAGFALPLCITSHTEGMDCMRALLPHKGALHAAVEILREAVEWKNRGLELLIRAHIEHICRNAFGALPLQNSRPA